ncbi:hypothetical protein [Faecalibacter bovis]|uniref:Outer membrane protein beta-barrel domain-containing protein n=1 Tax=Faecalibacter bovis TaxID=2898187 RepID=A0ABX7XE31_9FLAO|nr:hypothetical protein [Faecalibacter bovis]MBS7333853.1 hypothetical protein [Weeksellaceae bacterium]QTV06113.1 hypothetical protein J9309_01875 [Faecalibacter bovis]
MKKLVLVFTLFLGVNLFSQDTNKIGLQVNAYAGMPVGHIANDSSINFGVSLGYLGEVCDFLRVGGSVGYDHSVLKSDSQIQSSRGYQFLMIGATAELDLYQDLYFAADLGYAFNQTKEGLGSHYFTPKLGYHFSEDFDLYLHYKAVRFTGYQVASTGVGIAYNF